MSIYTESDLGALKASEALLEEIKIDYSKTNALEDVVEDIRKFLQGLKDKDIKATAMESFIKELGAPLDKLNFTFSKPHSVKIVGSFALKAVAIPVQNIDLAVQIPASCFLQQDFLNQRYHAKRALYLDFIKKKLKKSCSVVEEVYWSAFCNDARKPILVVKPVKKIDTADCNFVIRIIPTISCSVFDVKKLVPCRNNVRAFQQNGTGKPTPIYSSTILEDIFLEDVDSFVQNQIAESGAIVEALLLLKIWIRKRHSVNASDCLNGFLIAFMLAYLSVEKGERRIFTSQMSRMDIFRVFLNFLATSPALEKGIFLQTQSVERLSKEQKKIFKDAFEVVMCDSSTCFNLLFRMSKSGLVELRNEAAQTLQHIIAYGTRGFEELFMTTVDMPSKFDYQVRISPNKTDSSNEVTFSLDKEQWRSYEKEVESILSRALGERAQLVRVIPRKIPPNWNPKKGLSSLSEIPVHIGVLISSFEKGFRMIDIGPSADKKEEAAKFRQFWGERSELRRFKDGVVAECSVWDCEFWEKHLIIKKIIEYILGRHLKLSSRDICVVSSQLDFTLMKKGKDPIAFMTSLLSAFEDLSKRLRSLQELPLQVSSVQPLDPAYRQTSVFPPKPHPLARPKEKQRWSEKLLPTCVHPMEVLVQLEGSGNWPFDDVAMEKTKTAFSILIADIMEKKFDAVPVAAEEAVDLLVSGFAFRLRISCEKDKSLLKRPGLLNGLLPGTIQPRSVVPLEKDFLLRSHHASMVNGLQGLYPFYSPIVRLAKRWISTHMLSGVLADEAIELLVAYLFVKPFPFRAPSSRVTGFLRFLRLIADYDWDMFPLIVDINADLSTKEKEKIISQFAAKRNEAQGNNSADSALPAMYIATTYDRECETWTAKSPDKLALKRLIAYARSSANLLTRLIDGDAPVGWESLFCTPLQCYDALLVLHRDKLAYPNQLLFKTDLKQESEVVASWNASTEFFPYILPSIVKKGFESARRSLLVGFDPLKAFIEHLKATKFSEYFNIWYDGFGSEVIGLTWTEKFPSSNAHHLEPERGASRKRKRKPESQGPRHDAKNLLKEIGRVGRGLVKSVHLLKVPNSDKN